MPENQRVSKVIGSVGERASRPRVLVIDDEALVAKAIALTLTDECDVTVALSAREALDLFSSGARFDMILCDLLMPLMTGMDLYAELTRRRPEIAATVVFMTGGASTPRARSFVASVPNRCLDKPIDADELRELVRTFREAAATHRAFP